MKIFEDVDPDQIHKVLVTQMRPVVFGCTTETIENSVLQKTTVVHMEDSKANQQTAQELGDPTQDFHLSHSLSFALKVKKITWTQMQWKLSV